MLVEVVERISEASALPCPSCVDVLGSVAKALLCPGREAVAKIGGILVLHRQGSSS